MTTTTRRKLEAERSRAANNAAWIRANTVGREMAELAERHEAKVKQIDAKLGR